MIAKKQGMEDQGNGKSQENSVGRGQRHAEGDGWPAPIPAAGGLGCSVHPGTSKRRHRDL